MQDEKYKQPTGGGRGGGMVGDPTADSVGNYSIVVYYSYILYTMFVYYSYILQYIVYSIYTIYSIWNDSIFVKFDYQKTAAVKTSC